ncbi:CRISPR-associated helicase/endonuclease Cas3 [Pseudoalteromonas denitrificans]|uniref:CRISPR-associated endonuclease/helicase Cas3 n=1 Tax=Pseudoalteromonas denitrificans DSM 6059 TaxID=1123010 RepID=A0A1I1TXU5_9GAMM|nr:CRISPR-associated helicase/endonuclease Cas3 [Pseudoalteromonas denitrificans]SFD62108.1 CRISPR-associated endonuclease/helicase Cas3 [Pseudoalteromonas denitrificans DSM 6059]
MMVTFISQCEKNALKKTRRVLDAFANRIGNNTWQTLITEDGLQTVKKMLRQTASKSTAVSCHWIRSRSRSQFLWVVGNKLKFNGEGVVPVNSTQVIDIKMDENKMMNKKAYANTNKQPLDQHLFAVGYVASELMKRITNSDDTKKLAHVAFVAGCLHDIGKLDPEFQQWLNGLLNKNKHLNEECDGLHIDKGKFSFETHASHNEISLLMYHLMNNENDNKINKQNKNIIKHAIYWHHAKRFRKEELKNLAYIFKKTQKSLANIKFNDFYDVSMHLVQSVNQLSKNYGANFQIDGLLKKLDKEKLEDIAEPNLPAYKKYSEINEDVKDFSQEVIFNAKNNLIRTAVISADRLVSQLSSEQLNQHIEQQTLITLSDKALLNDRGLVTQIKECIAGFEKVYPNSERNQLQSKAAIELAICDDESHVKVLNGPAGCGKTKIALEWALNTHAKKIIWICPRVQVCQGLFNDLTSQEYLPNAQIEINTGELKYINREDNETPEGKAFSGDIVLTTIDQIINAITTHRHVTNLVDFMNAHIVFDEFHEYINMPAFNLLFAELIQAKKWQEEKASTLLVSATPNYFFIEKFLVIDDIVDMPSFNQSKYQIEFNTFDETIVDDTNPLYHQQKQSDANNVTFVISNTATAAQVSFIQHQQDENAILFHSKFKKSDKLKLFNKVFDSFKNGGSRKFSLLRSGPVVQASLNISCDHMVSEFTHAENWLQRLGRLDRFGVNEDVNTYIIAIPESIQLGKGNGGCARFLGSLFSFQSAKAWYEFLKEINATTKVVTIAEIYQWYSDFYNTSKGQRAVEEDLLTVLKKSAQLINAKVHDPMSPPKRKVSNKKLTMKKSSLRGDSRFVNMAICDLTVSETPVILDKYVIANDEQGGLTESLDTIRNTGLIDYIAQKDSRINENTLLKGIPAKQMNKRKVLLEGAATSPENAIYLSYISEDLNKIGESEPHDEAIYYAVCDKQAIGKISKNQIINKLMFNK